MTQTKFILEKDVQGIQFIGLSSETGYLLNFSMMNRGIEFNQMLKSLKEGERIEIRKVK